MDIFPLLQLAKENGASDLHLVSSSPPLNRVNGYLDPMVDLPPLTPEDMEQILEQLTTEKQRADFQQRKELDFGCDIVQY